MSAFPPFRLIFATFLLVGFFAETRLLAEAEKTRMALVIGNAAYSVPLKTSYQDAEDFAKSLRNLKFQEATLLPNATLIQMRAALKTFADKAATADDVLFYFAGHGVQVGNRNYLIPTDAHIHTIQDIPDVALALDEVYDVMADLPAPVKLVILDACRDNPFSQSAADWPKGLAKPIGAPSGTMTIFAAEPGETARDGRANHSPFTSELLYFMTEPGLELHSLYIAVRNKVEDKTEGQIPYQDGSPSREFYFREPASIVGEIPEADDEVLVLINGEETMSFNSDGSTPMTIPLQPGENHVVIKVFNQNTFRGACNWFRQTFEQIRPTLELLGIHPDEIQNPEGWKYKVRFRLKPDSAVLEEFYGTEDIPQMNGPHHGKMFTVARAVILVDRVTGEVSFDKSRMEREVWKTQN